MQAGRRARGYTLAGGLLVAGGASAIALALALQDPAARPVTAAGSLGPAVPSASATASASPGSSASPGAGTGPAATATPAAHRAVSGTEAPASDFVSDPLPRSEPIALDIPAIGVHTEVFPIGLNPDGTIAVPAPGPRYDSAAWYRYSPTPGQVGPSVIEGHLDSASDGPSVFYRLGELEPGDEISIGRADGLTAVFRVTGRRSYPKAEFPTSSVYGDLDYPGLRLITCGGGLDSTTRHYLDNTVVYAALASAHPSAPTHG